MVTIRIGDDERIIRSKSEIEEAWINQQINRRNKDHLQVCVRVTIEYEDVRVTLITPTCRPGGGGGQLNQKEEALLELWKKQGLNRQDFTGGNLIAFLRHLSMLR